MAVSLVGALSLGGVSGVQAYKSEKIESLLLSQIDQIDQLSRGKIKIQYDNVSSPINSNKITFDNVEITVETAVLEGYKNAKISIDQMAIAGDYENAFATQTMPNDIELSINGLVLTKENWDLLSPYSLLVGGDPYWKEIFGGNVSEIKGDLNLTARTSADGSHVGSFGLALESMFSEKFDWELSGLPASIDLTSPTALQSVLSKLKLHHLSVNLTNDGLIDKLLAEAARDDRISLSEFKDENKKKAEMILNDGISELQKNFGLNDKDAKALVNKDLVLSLFDKFNSVDFSVSYASGLSVEDLTTLNKYNSRNGKDVYVAIAFLITLLDDLNIELKANNSDVIDMDITKGIVRKLI